LFGLSTFLNFQPAATAIDETAFATSDIIERDVCVIGGGASGTYAAVRLRQNGKSVALIEKEDRLGGHVNTYIDPVTKVSFDYGVVYWVNISVVVDFARSLNVPLAILHANQTLNFGNFANGSLVPASKLPSFTAQAKALLTYRKILTGYPWLNNGFDLPDPIPAELLLPFGEFIQKHNITAISTVTFLVAQGAANILARPALYIMKYFPTTTIDGFIHDNFVSTANQNNQGLYDAGLAYIGNRTNVFLGSKITQIERDDCGVKVVVSTPDGVKLVKASQLLLTIPPKLETLESIGMDIDEQEKYLFGQFNNTYVWDMIISNAGIPTSKGMIVNVNPGAPDELASLPGLAFIRPAPVPNLYFGYYGSPNYLSDDQLKADILAEVARINTVNGFPTNGTPKFVTINNHSPYFLTVPVEAIKNGFYRDVNAMQGQRKTWWAGAAFQTHDTSLIWNWTEHTLLPKILATL